MPIWASVVATETLTVAKIITRDGKTSVGAKRKICVTYNREVREVRPALNTMR